MKYKSIKTAVNPRFQLVDKLIDKLSGFEKGSVGFREKGT